MTNPVVQVEYQGLDPIFREFYDYLGAEPVLGEVISDVQFQGETKIQYTENVVLIYDPFDIEASRFKLAPLGASMGIAEPPVPKPSDSDALYINGHIVYASFVPFFKNLKGTRFLGKPLTEARRNRDQKRIEQYFENVGLYRMQDEPEDHVHLLAYGAWVCQNECYGSPPESSKVDLYGAITPKFSQLVNQLGTDFTGFSLTEIYTSADGWKEQIYENVVIGEDPQGKVQLRSLSRILKTKHGELETEQDDSPLVFYPVAGNQGYYIPQDFVEYLETHGSYAVSGAPITGVHADDLNGSRQCFENLCLIKEEIDPGIWRIHPEPLGRSYRSLYYVSEDSIRPGMLKEQNIKLVVQEQYPLLGINQQQIITVTAEKNRAPVAGLDIDLTIGLGQDNQQTLSMPPTGEDGITQYRLPKIVGSHGTIILYRVCVHDTTPAQCTQDRFVLWNVH